MSENESMRNASTVRVCLNIVGIEREGGSFVVCIFG